MNMTLHVFKKDLFRLRAVLAAWALLVALECTLVGVGAHPQNRMLEYLYYTLAGLIPLFEILLVIVIVPLLVQADPTVGTSAFLSTRPVSRRDLLQAKALFVLLLVAVPAAARTATLAANGVTAHDLALAVPQIFLQQTGPALTAAAIAVLTPNFGWFAIVGVSLVIFDAMAGLLIVWLRAVAHGADLASLSGVVSLTKSRGLVSALLGMAGAAFVCAHQVLTRRTGRSIVAAVAFVLGGLALIGWWPWDFLAPRTEPLADTPAASAVRVSLHPGASAQDLMTLRGGAESNKQVSAQFDFSGLPDGWVAEPQTVRTTLRRADGGIVPAKDPPPALALGLAAKVQAALGMNAPLPALEAALGGPLVTNAGPVRVAPTYPVAILDADTFRRYSGQPLRLSADVRFLASRYVATGEMPLRVGARYDHGSTHEEVTDVLRGSDGVDIVLRTQRVDLLFARIDTATLLGQALDTNVVYLLVNRARGEALLPKPNFGMDLLAMLPRIGIHELIKNTERLSYGPNPQLMQYTPPLTDDWLAGATLVRLERVPVGTFSRTVTVDDFKLGAITSPEKRLSLQRPPSNDGRLERITLPPNPTDAQVKTYVDLVLEVARGEGGSGLPTDPAVAQLAKVGSEHLSLLLDAFDAPPAQAWLPLQIELAAAAAELARPGDEALILGALSRHPPLISVVTHFRWQHDARPILLAGLKDEKQRSLPAPWIAAVVSFRDPATYPDLEAYLVRCANRQQTFALIRRLPGIDLASTVDAAWKQAKGGEMMEVIDAGGMAMYYGHFDALEAAVEILRQPDASSYLRRRAAQLVKRRTPATGSDTDLVAWFDANRGKLVFDAHEHEFLPQP